MLRFRQKQHSRCVLRKRNSENMLQVYRRTPMPSVISIRRPFLKAVLHGTISVIRFGWLLFGFKISSYKSEEIGFILCFKGSLHTTIFWKYTELFNILKYRIIQYSKNICHMVKNIFKMHKRITFWLKKIICAQWKKLNQFYFIHYTEIIFLIKTQ